VLSVADAVESISPADIASVSDLDHDDPPNLIQDFVDDTVVPLA
jgi:hypothetical protein